MLTLRLMVRDSCRVSIMIQAADEPTVFLDAETAKKYEENIKKAAAINDEILAENQTLGQHIEELKKQNLEKDVENEESKKTTANAITKSTTTTSQIHIRL